MAIHIYNISIAVVGPNDVCIWLVLYWVKVVGMKDT